MKRKAKAKSKKTSKRTAKLKATWLHSFVNLAHKSMTFDKTSGHIPSDWNEYIAAVNRVWDRLKAMIMRKQGIEIDHGQAIDTIYPTDPSKISFGSDIREEFQVDVSVKEMKDASTFDVLAVVITEKMYAQGLNP